MAEFGITFTSTYMFAEEDPKPCTNAYKRGNNWYVELASLNDLIALRMEVDTELILVSTNELEIYNTYRE